jgi:hypothetical protein
VNNKHGLKVASSLSAYAMDTFYMAGMQLLDFVLQFLTTTIPFIITLGSNSGMRIQNKSTPIASSCHEIAYLSLVCLFVR